MTDSLLEICKQNILNDTIPSISVHVVTFMHEDFIGKCLDGILSQKTNFPIEIIVHDDASKDRTTHVIKDYENKFPNLFRVIYQFENQYSKKGFKDIKSNMLELTRGKYIALCEGDDYWTDPLKLQKQFDFLENNQNYVLCFHKVEILKINGTLVKDFITSIPENYENQETLALKGNYIHTPSIVYRNVLNKFPKESDYAPLGDYFLYMLLSEYGKFKYIDEEMCVYREGVGIFSSKSLFYMNFKTAETFALLINVFDSNIKLKDIFLNRIIQFIVNFHEFLEVRDLIILSKNKFIEQRIYETFIELKTKEKINIEQLTFIEILKLLYYRIKHKIIFKIFKQNVNK